MPDTIKKAFLQPDDEFTPFPFWFWNDEVTEAGIDQQLQAFAAKGIKGVVIHPRIGMPSTLAYLSDRFMELIRYAVCQAAANGLKVILYDEGMYPSGSAHGLVVAGNPEYAARGLRLVDLPCDGRREIIPELTAGERIVTALLVAKTGAQTIVDGSERPLPVAGDRVRLAGALPGNDGRHSVLIFIETFTRGTIRGIHFGEDDGEPGAPLAADLLNPAAMAKFIRVTHERYYQCLAEHFGQTVIGFFTDEPDILGRCPQPGVKPWTPGLLEWYRHCHHEELKLAALWYDVADSATIRRRFQQALRLRLESSYYQPLHDWCDQHGIVLTGHPHESDEIGLMKYFQIPGQDLVWRWVAPEANKGLEGRHSTLAKCSSDAARHCGKRRNANEVLGCCGPNGIHWAMSADDIKWYLDWLFVRGVNLIIPHAFLYSVDGPLRKADRPPDVGLHNIWWPYFQTVVSYIKRMSWLMTDSVNQARVAVVSEADRLPWEVVKPLYQNQVEFNYLEASLLDAADCRVHGGLLRLGHQQYRVALFDDPALLRAHGAKLAQFSAGGGKVLVVAAPSQTTAPTGVQWLTDTTQLIAALEPWLPEFRFEPAQPDLRLSHLIKANRHFLVVTNEGETALRGDLAVELWGRVERWDAWNGTIEPVAVTTDAQTLRIPVRLARRASLIFCIDPQQPPVSATEPRDDKSIRKEITLQRSWKVSGLGAAERRRRVDCLASWTEWPGLTEFSGTVCYETTFNLEAADVQSTIELDLGTVGEIARVLINGVEAGFRLWAPFTFDISRFVTTGTNHLQVVVTNSLANRFSQAQIPSGLIGPVVVRGMG